MGPDGRIKNTKTADDKLVKVERAGVYGAPPPKNPYSAPAPPPPSHPTDCSPSCLSFICSPLATVAPRPNRSRQADGPR